MAGWLTATLGMTIAGRELAQDISVFQIMLLRSGIATLILLPFVLLNGGFRDRVSQLKLHLARNVIHYGGQYAWFSALLLIPLAEVIAIEFTMPLWIAILAVAFLGERMYGFKIAALVLGFGGVLMIVRPGLEFNPGHLVALTAALLFAGSVTLTKFITRRDTALTVIFMMFAMQSVMGAIPPMPHGCGRRSPAGSGSPSWRRPEPSRIIACRRRSRWPMRPSSCRWTSCACR